MTTEPNALHPRDPMPTYRPTMTRARSLRRSALAFVALATISLAACGDDDGGGSDDTTSAPSATTAAPTGTAAAGDDGAAAEEVTVVIEDVAFQTPEVTVRAGGTVTWDNQDNQAHTATGTGTDTFATDTIAPGEQKSVTFDDAGTFPYICSFHPFMKGTVTVE